MIVRQDKKIIASDFCGCEIKETPMYRNGAIHIKAESAGGLYGTFKRRDIHICAECAKKLKQAMKEIVNKREAEEWRAI